MATQNEYQLDSIFHALGPKGRFAKFQMMIIWLGMFPTGFQLLSNVFIGPKVPHRCAPAKNQSLQFEDFGHYNGEVNFTYSECEINFKINGTTVNTEECLYGMEYDVSVDSSFISEFDLVCGWTNLARLTQTLVIAGQAFGAILGCMIADKFGRRIVVIGSNLGLFFTGLAIAYAPNVTIFATLKFIVGGFQQALVAVCATLFVELMVVDDRRVAAVLKLLSWASAVILLDVVAFILKGYSWRTVQMALCLGSVPVVIQWIFLKDSLRWLLANGKTKEATEYVTCAAKMNGKRSEDILEVVECFITSKARRQARDETMVVSDANYEAVSTRKLSYLDIFRIPRLLYNTLIMWIAWFTTALGFFAIYLTSTSLAGDRYLNFFLTALMEIPCSFLFYFGLNRFGRKSVLIWVFMMMSFGIIGSGIFKSLEQNSTNSSLAVVFSLIAMVGASGCFGLVFIYTPELFPTNIRNQALGISSMMSRVGGMLAPFTGVLSDLAKWGPGVLIGALACLVAVLLRFVPETNGRELPQTLEELQAWFKKDNNNSNTNEKKDAKV